MIARRVSTGKRFGREDAFHVARKILDEERGDVCGRIRDRRRVEALLADLVERRENWQSVRISRC